MPVGDLGVYTFDILHTLWWRLVQTTIY